MVRSTLTLLALFNVAMLFPGKVMSQNSEGREFNGKYQKEYLDKIAFPIGGIGAGMFCLEGTGAISHVSLRHHPDVMNEPYTFAAIYVKGVENGAKVLEGQVPTWKWFGPAQSGLGRGDKTYGLPRFEEAVFQTRFNFSSKICHSFPGNTNKHPSKPFVTINSFFSSSLNLEGMISLPLASTV